MKVPNSPSGLCGRKATVKKKHRDNNKNTLIFYGAVPRLESSTSPGLTVTVQ